MKLYRITKLGLDDYSDVVLGYTFGTEDEVNNVAGRIIDRLGDDTVLHVVEVPAAVEVKEAA